MYGMFTERARQVMELANEEASLFGKESYIDTHHLLLALVREDSGLAAYVLKERGVNVVKIRAEIEQLSELGPYKEMNGKLPTTPALKTVIEYSLEEANKLNHNYVGTEHLLLGLAREQEGVAAKVLRNLQIEPKILRKDVLEVLGHQLDGRFL